MKKKIKYLFTGVALVAVAAIASCSDDDKKKLPDVNGFSSADEVAADNLLAYWDFEGSNNETISDNAPTTAEGDSFTEGIKGQALSLNDGYLLYPAIPALNTANAFPNVTVSCWVNIDNNNTSVSSIFNITQETSTQTGWNNSAVFLYAETAKPAAVGDTLVLHAGFSTYIDDVIYRGDNINDYGIRGTDFQTLKGAGQWVHYVMRYNAAESNIDLYANGVRVSNNNFRHRTYNPGVETGLGVINQKTPTHVLIGSFATSPAGFTNSAAESWMDFLTGDVDEIRVYNKALTDLEIGSLYALELAGR